MNLTKKGIVSAFVFRENEASIRFSHIEGSKFYSSCSCMITIQTERPREVNSWRAAGILYGDLGTSKAYVLGLAFALASYSSFWFILAVSILTLFVGLNYIEICKLYPNGGGVYTSARNRSKVLALIGGFFYNFRLYCNCSTQRCICLSLSWCSSSRVLGHPFYWHHWTL